MSVLVHFLARHSGGFETGQNIIHRGVQCAGKMPHLVGRGNNWWHNQQAISQRTDDEAMLAGGEGDLETDAQIGGPAAVTVAGDEVKGAGEAKLADLGDIGVSGEMRP